MIVSQSQNLYAPTLTITKYPRGTRAPTWRGRLAWFLRNLADRYDPGLTVHYSGNMHQTLSGKDVDDALFQGLIGMQKYMADLAQDRSVL